MSAPDQNGFIVGPDDVVLVTGAAGFIGKRVVRSLLDRGVRRIRCFVRNSTPPSKLQDLRSQAGVAELEVFRGNLLSPDDCRLATKGVSVVIHLAAGRGEKSFPDAFMNSVVTTRNLLEACLQPGGIKRFVNVSSFAVYSNTHKPHGNLLDEACPMEACPEVRGDAYSFAKSRQDDIVMQYGRDRGVPHVLIRPGVVYGPGNVSIHGRVGIDTFGIFLHLGGSNRIPFTYVDNCADAIALAALKPAIDGEVFNVVDDDLPTSRQFLKLYKRNVRRFRSLYVPKVLSYMLCSLWEKYSIWSRGQLPPVFNRSRWNAAWRNTRYSNAKLKNLLEWQPAVSTREGLRRYFEAARAVRKHA
jgi:nucleoside-diphosphate-sugar epimerase